MVIDLRLGDCLEVMKTLPDNSVDACVTDPPYGLSFMGKKWDYDVPSQEIWEEALRVLKPGGYLLSFAGTRTQHRMAVRIEDAGFEIRDMIAWVYGSGFPKSLNIGKAVDKLQGNEREDLGIDEARAKRLVNQMEHSNPTGTWQAGKRIVNVSKGTSDWEGWGTALKPALEPITVARKPLSEKNVAENVLKWGVGGIDIDGSRVGTDESLARPYGGDNEVYGEYKMERGTITGEGLTGRFPANLIHDGSDEVVGLFPNVKTGSIKPHINAGSSFQASKTITATFTGDSGSAARFFKTCSPTLEDMQDAQRFAYIPKASKSERNMGCEGMEKKESTKQFNEGMEGQVRSDGTVIKPPIKQQNFHPTVKPIALMEYLVKLVSREGATVLDPFMGSGSTGIACRNLKRNFIGIELDPEYLKIAEARINSIHQESLI